MARFVTSDDINRQLPVTEDADAQRREESKAARSKLAKEAAELGGPVLDLIAALPAAFVASQQAEIERLSVVDKQHPRRAQVEATIDELMSAAPMATRVLARATRGLNVARTRASGFYGFVSSSSDGTPLEGAIVRVGEGTTLRAKTEQDGYFMIPLTRTTPGTRATPGTQAATEGDKSGLKITISTEAGEVLHEDPSPLNPDIGFAYREYVIDVQKPRKPVTRRS